MEIKMTDRMCNVCGIRLCPSGYDTCSLSECQEASYYRNKARNMRRGTKAWREAFGVAERKITMAIAAAERRARGTQFRASPRIPV
jgi:hypothetical protein